MCGFLVQLFMLCRYYFLKISDRMILMYFYLQPKPNSTFPLIFPWPAILYVDNHHPHFLFPFLVVKGSVLTYLFFFEQLLIHFTPPYFASCIFTWHHKVGHHFTHGNIHIATYLNKTKILPRGTISQPFLTQKEEPNFYGTAPIQFIK